MPDTRERNALMMSAFHGQKAMVEFLLDHIKTDEEVDNWVQRDAKNNDRFNLEELKEQPLHFMGGRNGLPKELLGYHDHSIALHRNTLLHWALLERSTHPGYAQAPEYQVTCTPDIDHALDVHTATDLANRKAEVAWFLFQKEYYYFLVKNQ